MSTSLDRIMVFEDTMKWIKEEKDLSLAVRKSLEQSEVYYEDDYPDFDKSKENETVITVTGDRSFQAAMRLKAENPNSKIAVMNFANAFHPGGGVVDGASAQEECLCRTSTLYPVLNSGTMRDTYYLYHHNNKDFKASDSLIYVEGVVICKTDEDIPVRMAKENWVTVDVITVAAPDLRYAGNKYVKLFGNGSGMSDEDLFKCHLKRARHILTCAAAKGAEALVLGAFGCGAFQNNPEIVAKAYRQALSDFPKVFKKIEFAVFCPPGNDTNYKIFSRELK